MQINVRAERPEDHPAVDGVIRRAYVDIPYSDHREHIMVERLRDSDAYVPSLSLIAEIEGEAVGHILLTRASIRGKQASVPALALAPLSVVPTHQGCGIGSKLVLTAHERARKLEFSSIILVGLPRYYPRFGYQPLERYPIALPFVAPPANCMILPLSPAALDGVCGTVEYAPEWLDH